MTGACCVRARASRAAGRRGCCCGPRTDARSAHRLRGGNFAIAKRLLLRAAHRRPECAPAQGRARRLRRWNSAAANRWLQAAQQPLAGLPATAAESVKSACCCTARRGPSGEAPAARAPAAGPTRGPCSYARYQPG
eukprot:352409-Chlamydomonas_euryale.AAC.3